MIPTPISTASAGHYSWGGSCDGWHLVRAAGWSVIEERMPPGTCEQRHWHSRASQFFYILAGTLTMEVEGQRHLLGPRSGLELPQGVAHQAINESDADVEFLVVSVPPSRGDRIGTE